MYELLKYREAVFFLREMRERVDEREEFTFLVSAFLSSARSVLQLAWEEVKGTPDQAWYENWIANSDVLKFFKNRRDVNIHQEPIELGREVKQTFADHLTVWETVTVFKKDEEGNDQARITTSKGPNPDPEPEGAERTETEARYLFHEWPGPEDVLDLCSEYSKELAEFIRQGEAGGHLKAPVGNAG